MECCTMGLSPGNAAMRASRIRVTPAIWRKRFMLEIRTIQEVMMPTPMTAGMVPRPNASMVNVLRTTSPVVADKANAV